MNPSASTLALPQTRRPLSRTSSAPRTMSGFQVVVLYSMTLTKVKFDFIFLVHLGSAASCSHGLAVSDKYCGTHLNQMESEASVPICGEW